MNPLATAQASNALLFWINAEGRFLDANEQACHALGYSRQELQTLTVWDIDPDFPRERWPDHWQELRQAKTLHFPTTHRRRDGSQSPIEVFAHYLELDGHEYNCALAYPLTTQRQTETALRESEERLALALAVSGQGLYDLEISTGKTIFSAEYARMLGYEPSELELTPATWASWLHPEEREWILSLYEDCITGKQPDYQAEFRLRTRAGDWIWVRSVGRVVQRDAVGRPLRLIGTHLNITEQKQAEAALRESEERFAKAFHASPAPLGITEIETGRFLDVNEQLLRMFDYTREQMIGHTSVELGAWADPGTREQMIAQLCAEGFFREELTRFRTRTGEIRQALYSAEILRLGARKVLLSLVYDITEKKRAEEALRESEERFRSIFAYAPLGIALVNGVDGQISISNAAFQHLLGYSAEQVQHLTVAEITHPDDLGKDLKQYHALLEDRISNYRMEKRYLRQDGATVWVDLTVAAVRDETGKPIHALGMVEDITRRKQMEEALRASEAFLDSVIAQSPLPIVIYDAAGMVVRFNQASRELFQVTDQVVGRYNLLQDEQLREQGYMPLFERVLRLGETARAQSHYNAAPLQASPPACPHWLDLDSTIFPIRDASGHITHAVVFHVDITDRKAAEARLRYHLELEQALAEISALMIKPGWNDFDARMNWTLERIGCLTQVDRSYFFMVTPDGLTMSNTHEWCAQDIHPQIQDLQNLPVADYRPFYDLLQQQEVVEIQTASLSDDTILKPLLLQGGIRSLICVPVNWGGKLQGFIGLDAVSTERIWQEEDSRLLRMVAEIIAHTLQHIESEKTLRDNAHFLENLDRISRILMERSREVDVIAELATAILDIFQADRAFFLYPCDPNAVTFHIRFEATRPEWPGVFASGAEITPDGVEIVPDDVFRRDLQQTLRHDGPMLFEFTGASESSELVRRYDVQSHMVIVLYPQSDQPWVLGVHQCAYARRWTNTEQRLFQAIAERVSDALSGHLLLKQLQESEQRYRTVFESAHDAIIVHDFQGVIQAVNQTMLTLYGLEYEEALKVAIADLSGPGNAPDPLNDHWPRVLRGEILHFEWNARRPKDGTCFPVEVMLRAVQFGGRNCVLSSVRDISERKRAEAALRASEERFAKAFHSSPAAIAISTLDEGRFLDANDRWLNLLGYTREEVVGRTSKEIELWIDREVRDRAIVELQRAGSLKDVLVQVRAKTGEQLEQLWSAEIVTLGDQRVVLSHFYDVTERKRAEEALRQSEERFAKAFRSNPAAMAITTLAEGRFIDVNEHWLELIGLARAELIGHTSKEINIWIDPGLRDRMITQLQESGLLKDVPVVIRARNGELREVLWSAEIIKLGEQSVLLSLVYDLTEQKRTEQALREIEARLRTAIESIPFDFFLIGDGSRYVLQNSASREHWGDVIGKCPEDIAPDAETLAHWNSNNRRAFAGEIIEEEVHFIIGAEDRYIHNVIAPVKDGDEIRGIVGLNIDITERKRVEAELQRYREHLEELVAERTAALQQANADLRQAMTQLVQAEKLAALGNLVAGVAHELNTPLGNARMVASTLAEHLHEFAAAVETGALRRSHVAEFLNRGQEAVDLLERNTARAADLISHFKQVAVDQTSMRRRGFNLRQTVEEVLATLRPAFKRSAHRIEVEIPPDLDLDSYPGPLEQVLANLISNSLTHGFAGMEAGCIQLRATRLETARFQLRYTDNGVGIPTALQTRIFDPFFTTRLGQGGSGLGLYIAYNLVTGVLGGTIQVHSRLGQGVAFTLTLPCTAPERQSVDFIP